MLRGPGPGDRGVQHPDDRFLGQPGLVLRPGLADERQLEGVLVDLEAEDGLAGYLGALDNHMVALDGDGLVAVDDLARVVEQDQLVVVDPEFVVTCRGAARTVDDPRDELPMPAARNVDLAAACVIVAVQMPSSGVVVASADELAAGAVLLSGMSVGAVEGAAVGAVVSSSEHPAVVGSSSVDATMAVARRCRFIRVSWSLEHQRTLAQAGGVGRWIGDGAGEPG